MRALSPVTGIGAITPMANDRETAWQALLDGRSGVAPISAFDASGLPVRSAAEVKGFAPRTLPDHKRLRRSERFSRLAVAAAREAVRDATLAIGTDEVTVR